MSHLSGRRLARLAAIGALVAAFGLGGCGRKGGLDPPPGAAAVGPSVPAQSPQSGADGKAPVPAPGPPRRTPIDWLID